MSILINVTNILINKKEPYAALIYLMMKWCGSNSPHVGSVL